MMNLLLIIACGDGFTFENFNYAEEHSSHIPLIEGLYSPTLLTVYGDNLYTLESEVNLVHQISNEGIQGSTEMTYLPEYLYAGSSLLAVTEEGIFDVANEILLHEAYEATHVFEIDGTLYWTEEHVAGTEIHNEADSVLIEIYSLDDLHVYNGNLWAIDQNYSSLVWIDTSLPMTEWAGEVVVNFEDEARRMTMDNDAFYVTTRSMRWPYGGWIVKIQGTTNNMTTTRLTESPPEAEHIVVHNDTVYWSSKQSITAVASEGGTYNMIAPQTTVGGMVIHEGGLWWTDTKGGRIFNTPLE